MKTEEEKLMSKKLLSFQRCRAQAQFLDQDWRLTFEEYLTFWNDETWPLRGKNAEELCMIRRDYEGAWDKFNCVLVTRRRHMQIANKTKAGKCTDELFKEAITYPGTNHG